MGVVELRLGTQAMLSESPAPRLRIAGRESGEGARPRVIPWACWRKERRSKDNHSTLIENRNKNSRKIERHSEVRESLERHECKEGNNVLVVL
jgi:hypothetical protein